MSNSGQIRIVDKGIPPTYIYTHSCADELPWQLQLVLRRRQRWSDVQYFNRILICEMVRADIEGELGYGIGSRETFHDRSFDIVVNIAKNTVDFNGQTFTFDEYCDLSSAHLPRY